MQLPKVPLLTYMLQGAAAEKMLTDTSQAVQNGADAIGLQLEIIDPQLVNPSFIDDVVKAAEGRPLYVTNYRRGNHSPQKSDDILAQELLEALDHGALIIDVPGNMFAHSDIEINYEPKVIKKQREFIDEIHKRGGIALMSSHMFKFMKRDEVYELAKTHENRGADISKIVTNANTDDELTENLIISAELKNKIGIPYLFLCNGKFCARHRMLTTALGSCMMLCSTDKIPEHTQPNLSFGKDMLELIEKHRKNLNEI